MKKNLICGLRAIIFDFDNTLYDGPIWDAWGVYLRKFIDLNFDDGEKFFKEYYINNTTTGAEIAEILIKLYGSAELFYNYQKDVLFDYDSDLVTVVNTKNLEKLSQKFKLFVVSNSHVNYIKYQMDRFGIKKEIFTEILDNKFALEDRSKAVNYKYILNQYGFKADEVLVIGDSLNKDIVPAKNVGLKTYHLTSIEDTNSIIDELLDCSC